MWSLYLAASSKQFLGAGFLLKQLFTTTLFLLYRKNEIGMLQ